MVLPVITGPKGNSKELPTSVDATSEKESSERGTSGDQRKQQAESKTRDSWGVAGDYYIQRILSHPISSWCIYVLIIASDKRDPYFRLKASISSILLLLQIGAVVVVVCFDLVSFAVTSELFTAEFSWTLLSGVLAITTATVAYLLSRIPTVASLSGGVLGLFPFLIHATIHGYIISSDNVETIRLQSIAFASLIYTLVLGSVMLPIYLAGPLAFLGTVIMIFVAFPFEMTISSILGQSSISSSTLYQEGILFVVFVLTALLVLVESTVLFLVWLSLHVSQKFYLSILGVIPLAMVIMDVECQEIFYLNRDAWRLCGETPDDQRGPAYTITQEKDAPKVAPMPKAPFPASKMFKSSIPEFPMENVQVASGRKVLVRNNAIIEPPVAGAVFWISPARRKLRLVALIEEGSVAVHIANLLHYKPRLLPATSRTSQRLLRIMSHEVRTPLNSILLSIQLMDDQHNNESVISLKNNVDVMLALINDVTELAELDGAVRTSDTFEFDLVNLLHDVTREVCAQKDAQDVDNADRGLSYRVTLSLLAQAFPKLEGDERRVRKVLRHVLTVMSNRSADGALLEVDWAPIPHKESEIGVNFKVTTCMTQSQIDALIVDWDWDYSGVLESFQYSNSGLALAIAKLQCLRMNSQMILDWDDGVVSVTFKLTFRVSQEVLPGLESLSQPLKVIEILLLSNPESLFMIKSIAQSLSFCGVRVMVSDDPSTVVALLRNRSAPGMRKLGHPLSALQHYGVKRSSSGTISFGIEAVFFMASLANMKSLLQLRREPVLKTTKFYSFGRLIDLPPESTALLALRGSINYPLLPSELKRLLFLQTTDKNDVDVAIAPLSEPVLEEKSHLSILLVDDNVHNLKFTKRLVEQLGYSIATATNGMEALDLVDTNDFALILMDVQMPIMDGIECTRQIRRKEIEGFWKGSKRVPIIALTAHAMIEDEKRCIDAGMDGFLAKPVRKANLHAILDRWWPKKVEVEAPKGIEMEETEKPTPLVNFSALYELYPGSKHKVGQSLNELLENCDNTMSSLKQAVMLQDVRTIIRHAKQFRQHTQDLEMVQLSTSLYQLQICAKEKQFDSLPLRFEVVQQKVEETKAFVTKTLSESIAMAR